MSSPTTITCPHCNGRLKLKDRSKLGQKVTCPKCRKPFKAQEQLDDEDEFASRIMTASEEDEEEFSLPPRRSSSVRQPAPGRAKPRPKSTGSRLPLVVGGLAALLLLGGVGFAIWHFQGDGDLPVRQVAADAPAAPAGPAAPAPAAVQARKSIDFAWLPAQPEMVISIRPSELLKSEFAQWVIDAADGRDAFNQGQERIRQEVGVRFDEIESITIGIKSLRELVAGAAEMAPGGMPNPLQAASGLSKLREKEVVAVVRLTKPVDLAANSQLQQQSEARTHGNATYYREKSTSGESPSVIYAPTATLVVITGREDVLKGLIDRQGQADPRPELEIVDPAQHLAIGLFIDQSSLAGQAADANSPMAVFRKIQSASLGIKAGAGLEVSIRQLYPDSNTAQEVKGATDNLLVQGKEQLSQLAGLVPPNLNQLANTLLTSAQSTQRDRMVETVSSLPPSSREQLQAMPGELLAAVMMRGMGNGPAGPPGIGAGAIGRDFGSSSSGDDLRGDAVIAERLAGLPEDITLQARAGWSNIEMFEQDGKTPQPRALTIDLEYLGGQAAKGVEYGNVRVTRLTTEPEQHLKLAEKPGTFGEASPFKEFVDIKRGDYLSDHPANGFRAGLYLERPLVPPTRIAAVEGTLSLKYAQETKEVVVPKLLEQAGKQPTDSDLKAAGFAVSIKSEEGEKSLSVSFARGVKVADLKLVGPEGDPFPDSPFLLRMDYEGVTRFNCSLPPGSRLGDMGAKVTLHTKLDEATLPFRFENLPLPAPPDPAAAPTAPWKLTSPKSKVPEGLTVEGRLKWENAVSFNGQPTAPEIHLAVDVTGAQAMHAIGVGFQKVDSAETDGRGTLKPKDGSLPFGGDRSKQYTLLGKNPLLNRHPPDGVQVVFPFEPSQAPFSTIRYAAGSFKLLVAQERKQTTLDKLPSRIGKPTTNADLRAAGLDIKLTKQGDGLSIQVTKGSPFAIGNVTLIRDSSDGAETSSFIYDPFSKSGSLYVGEEKIKASDALEITYYAGLTELAIPFEFDDLATPPLPKPDK